MFNFAVAGLYYLTLPKTSEKLRITKRSQQSEAFVLKSQTFGGLLLCFTLYSLVFSGLTFHLYPLFVENKLSPSIVAIGIGLLGPMQVIGRLLVWKFSKRAGIAHSARYVFFAFPVSVLAMIFLGPIWGLLMFIVTYGVANGIMTIVRGTAVPELLANDSYGSINSWISTPSTISKALGPFVFAYSFQHFSSYDPALMIALFATFIIVASYWYVTLKNRTIVRNACCQQLLYSKNNA
jgi:predicted MFS family arabinose efflux permease